MARMKFLCDAGRCIECNGCVTAWESFRPRARLSRSSFFASAGPTPLRTVSGEWRLEPEDCIRLDVGAFG